MSETNISFPIFPIEDGILRETSGQLTVEWTIPKFFKKRRLKSKPFLFSDAEWVLEVYPSGNTNPESQGWVCPFLHKKNSPTPIHVDAEIGIRKLDGSVLESFNFDAVFDDRQNGWGTHRLIKRNELSKSKNVVAPNGSVTLFCAARVRKFSSSADGAPAFQNPSLDEVKASRTESKINYESFLASENKVKALEEKLEDHQKKLFASRTESEINYENFLASENEVKALEEEIEDLEDQLCLSQMDSECHYNNFLLSKNEVKDLKEKSRDLEETLSALKKENETFQKTMQEFEKGVLMLSQQFEELYLTGCQTDVVINVKDTQFNAHRSVLDARSTVFRAMFEVDMAEKSNSSVNIEEFESSVVDDFLKFLYSGKFDVISSSNAVGLYFMADKYNVNELKEPCVECLTREISLESVFGIIHLARLRDEKKLLKTAKDYFLRNTYLIISSPQWLLFLEEYPAIANELFLEMVKSSANIE